MDYYEGTDLKFKVTLTAAGFSMADNYWQVEVYFGNKRKLYTKGDMIVDGGDYYLPIKTKDIQPCTVKMVATACVPDSDMPGGIRREVGIATLCTIKKTI